MDTVLIRFTSPALEDFWHAKGAPGDAIDSLSWQMAESSALKEVCDGNPVIFLLPQESVLNTTLDLPENASRQLLASIEYQVEDRLAQDIDDQHVAIGSTSESPLPVAVVSATLMDRCLMLTSELSLRLQAIISEANLCAFEPGFIRIAEIDQQLILRTGLNTAIKTDLAGLPVVLGLLAKDTHVRLLASGTELEGIELPEGWQFEIQPAGQTIHSLSESTVINLLQRRYRLTSPWLSFARQWRWAAIFLVGFFGLFAYNQFTTLQQLEEEVAQLKQQQFLLVRPYLPTGFSPDDNLKSLLIKEMGRQQGSSTEQGFLTSLQQFSAAQARYQQINVSRIAYQGDTLRVDLLADQLNPMEDLLQVIRRNNGSATLADLSVKPGEVSATLVVPGGSNG